MNNNSVAIDNQNILESIKILLGLRDVTAFDTELVIHINTMFSILNQIGVGPKEGFRLITWNETWSDFIKSEDLNFYSDVKDYIYIKVRLIFDPPQNSSLIEAYNRQLNEIEYRIYTQAGGY